jgi:hypothetical protein
MSTSCSPYLLKACFLFSPDYRVQKPLLKRPKGSWGVALECQGPGFPPQDHKKRERSLSNYIFTAMAYHLFNTPKNMTGCQWLTPEIRADQEDLSLKPTWANSSGNPILEKNSSHKRAGGVAQGVGPEFKHQYCKKRKCTHSSLKYTSHHNLFAWSVQFNGFWYIQNSVNITKISFRTFSSLPPNPCPH